MARLKLVLAMMMHETNTFSPVPTPLASFRPLQGEAAIAEFKDTNTQLGGFLHVAQQAGAEIVLPVAGGAHPSGYVERAAYEDMVEAIVGAVRGGCDAVFLALHGAMVAEHVDDGEGELLRRIRAVAPTVPIAVGLDFHSHMTAAMVDNATVITGYCTYPHVDMGDTGQRAGRTMMRALRGEIEPVMVWGSLPMMTSTLVHTPSRQPMKDVMDMAMAAEASGRGAQRLRVRRLPALRHPAHLTLGGHRVRSPDGRGPGPARPVARDGLGAAGGLPLPRRPAGRPGRPRPHAGRWTNRSGGPRRQHRLRRHPGRDERDRGGDAPGARPTWWPGPSAIRRACGASSRRAPRPASRCRWAGASTCRRSTSPGKPFSVTGKVTRITDGEFTVTGPMATGTRVRMGRTAVLDTGAMQIVVSEGRSEPFDTGVFTHCGIDPRRKKYVLIKSRQHFRAGFEPIARHIVLCDGDGVTSSDLRLFTYRNRRRPLYPFERDL